jgi:hypothetical protein
MLVNHEASLDPIFVLRTALSEFVSQHPAAVVHNYLKSRVNALL